MFRKSHKNLKLGYTMAGLIGSMVAGTHAWGQCGLAVAIQNIEGVQGQFNTEAQFGYEVAMALDNDGSKIMLVGSPAATIGDEFRAGKVFVYRMTGTGPWVFESELSAPDFAASDRFGAALAMDVATSTDRIFIGAPNAGPTATSDSGAVYVFQKNGANWQFSDKIAPTNGRHVDFGAAMAFGGGRLLIADPSYDALPPLEPSGTIFNNGQAWIYTFDVGWTVQAAIPARNAVDYAYFGASVAMSGDDIFIGETRNGANVPVQVHHYKYTFVGPGFQAQWRQSINPGTTLDSFGSSIAFDWAENLLVIGAPGRNDSAPSNSPGNAYVYTRPNANSPFVLSQTLSRNNGVGGDRFGNSVAFLNGPTCCPIQRLCVGSIGLEQLDGVGQPYPTGGVVVFNKVAGLWSQEHLILPSSGTAFGGAVAGALDQLAVGDTRASFAPVGLAGKVSTYTISNSGVTTGQQLGDPDPNFTSGGLFGHSVDISGSDMVVGAPHQHASNALVGGTAKVYRRVGSAWQFVGDLSLPTAPTRLLSPGDSLGTDVAISGDYIAVGMPYDNDGVNGNTGAVAIFRRISGVWQFSQLLQANDLAATDYFGLRVAMSGGRLIVGATGDNNANGSNAGAAYIFTRDAAGVYTQEAKLIAPDGAASDIFGSSVAIGAIGNITSTPVALVGAQSHDLPSANAGAVYAFKRESLIGGVVWNYVQKLPLSPSSGDTFGFDIELLGGTAFVSALLDDVAGQGTDAGSVHVFTSTNGNSWSFLSSITSPDGAAGERFGVNLDASGSDLIIGADADDGAGTNAGAAYRYRNISGVWTFQQKLTATAPGANDAFGRYVAISGSSIAVGAPQYDTGAFTDTGAVFAFDLNTAGATVATHPVSVNTCTGGPLTMSVVGAGPGPYTYSWQYRTSAVSLAAIPANGIIPGVATCTGMNTDTLTFTFVYPGAVQNFRCVVANACSGTGSNEATLTNCAADLDNGSDTGACDGGVDINDLLFLLDRFEQGSPDADLDNGTGLGIPDGGVDINDLLFFLGSFESGC